MNLQKILDLAQHTGYPAVSILLPTHRSHPDNKQDSIVLKNLIREAVERLSLEQSKRDSAAIVEKLNRIAEDHDHEHSLDGLAIFVSEDEEHVFKLPFPVEPRVQIDERFAIRDLVFAYNRSPQYFTLVLSEKPTRLYSCFRDVFEEVTWAKFPMHHGGPGGATRLPGGPGVNSSSTRDAHRIEFVKDIDSELSVVLKHHDLPVVVTGTEDFLSDWNANASNAGKVIATIAGSYDAANAHDLAAVVWPVAEESFRELREKNMDELGAAVGANQFASGLVQVWQAAQESRVGLVMVEEDYRQPGVLNADGGLPTLSDDSSDPGTVDDLVDSVIQKVLSSGGRVVFADPGTLEKHDRVAAALRY